MLVRFILYGLAGWNIEVMWTGFNELLRGNVNMVGHTSLWMFLIYGLGGILFEAVRKKINERKWYYRGLVWMYLIFAIELVSGLLLRVFSVEAWHYEGLFSVGGLIRLDYAPLWFAVGLIFEVLSDLISRSVKLRVLRKK